jgi:ParB family chromosome partitioning protein|tara:strand:- start:997 stop:1893 length:897 start_codon:yes stop_codon:yes gene_type:complete
MSKSSLKDTLSLLVDASNVRVQTAPDEADIDPKGKYCFIPLISLIPGEFQPRRHFNKDALQELAASISKDGVLQPLIVRPAKEGKYEIIAGERRWRASKLAGLNEVPAIVREINDESALAFGILENLQRENLNPIEEAEAFQRLIEDFALTHEEVSLRVGKSRAVITNSLRLLKLPDKVRLELINGKIQVGHAKSMISLPEDKCIYVLNEILLKRLSVRQTEKMVQGLAIKKKVKLHHIYEDTDKVKYLERQIARIFGTATIIKCNKHGEGKAELSFDSIEEFECAIMDLLKNLELRK